MKTVAQVMSSDVVTVEAGRTVADAAALMLDRRVSLLPVVDGEGLVGLLTMRELLRALPYRPVVEVMQRDVATASRDMPITAAYMLMEEQRIGQLPVVDEGRVVGLITIEGILRELGLPVDPLTELPWGAALRQRAVEYLKYGREIAIIFLDLDNFGQANKQFGHVAGDRWIKAVAEALRATIDPTRDLLCRYGGDEFAILTTQLRHEAEALGRRTLEAVSALRLSGPMAEFVLTASMGFAGGKRTTERQDVHFEATVDDLITLASRQSTQAKLQKSERTLRTAAVYAFESRLRLRRVSLSMVDDQVTASVELSLGADRYVGEAQDLSLSKDAYHLLAEAAVKAINQALPRPWQVVVEDVRLIRAEPVNVAAVTVRLEQDGEVTDRGAGYVPASGGDVQAVVKAALQAINRRVGRILAGLP